MQIINGFDFFPLHFDADGNLQQAAELDEFEHAASQATDSIWIAHGFRNDENDATGLYTRFLQTFRQHVDGPFAATLGTRKLIVAGIFWPSKQFSEDVKFDGSTAGIEDDAIEKERTRAKLIDLRNTLASAEQEPRIDAALQLLDHVDGNSAAQDEFVKNVLSLLDGSEPDPTEGLDRVRSKDGSALLDALALPIRNPVPPSAFDEGGTTAVDDVFVPDGDGGTQGLEAIAGSVFSRIDQFLNLTTWYLMKNRSGIVGATGVPKAVRDFNASAPNVKIHLVGHSLGGRLMAACAKTLAQDPIVRPDSLTLLEAAFSHFGFSANNGENQAGFFRAVVDKKVVKGPIMATFSAQDSVVGTVYAVASRLAGDNLQAIGDANDPFGGLGRNGTQKTTEAILGTKLHAPGTPYEFTAGKILNLDGSGGLITGHGDITNPSVTYAFACAVAAT